MAQTATAKLDDGDAFPTMTIDMLDDSSLTLPADFEGQWSIVLIYRGEW